MLFGAFHDEARDDREILIWPPVIQVCPCRPGGKHVFELAALQVGLIYGHIDRGALLVELRQLSPFLAKAAVDDAPKRGVIALLVVVNRLKRKRRSARVETLQESLSGLWVEWQEIALDIRIVMLHNYF